MQEGRHGERGKGERERKKSESRRLVQRRKEKEKQRDPPIKKGSKREEGRGQTDGDKKR